MNALDFKIGIAILLFFCSFCMGLSSIVFATSEVKTYFDASNKKIESQINFKLFYYVPVKLSYEWETNNEKEEYLYTFLTKNRLSETDTHYNYLGRDYYSVDIAKLDLPIKASVNNEVLFQLVKHDALNNPNGMISLTIKTFNSLNDGLFFLDQLKTDFNFNFRFIDLNTLI